LANDAGARVSAKGGVFAANCDGCHNRSEFLCVTVRVFYIIGYKAWEQFGYLVSSNPLRMAESFVRHGVRSKDEGQFRYR
jgi:hypothetical protein